MFYQRYYTESEKIVCKAINEMAPRQVHPILYYSNKSARTRPERPTGGVRRNLFGPPDQNEMARNFDIENARQLKRLNNYKIIGTIEPSSNVRPLPELIAKEVEEACKKENKKIENETENDKPEQKKRSDDDDDALTMRQRQIEKTPTLHTVRANTKTANEAARYKPYTTQTLITDVMPKRKAIPPP
ncbi:uncharacterized protein LOC126751602 [Bactrocera neohumeralis]|uniref:uncharacterized protein LOC126751602 n=1 Tax=Bactrocera neohumeralis TaxID=98809 RepID=UPI0021667841|nr:uncharacterized protein LOC126751602 [Bactrocera neohumeralis]